MKIGYYVWLPDLITLETFKGDWEKYLESIYNIFKRDFVDDKPHFQGARLALKRHPMVKGKEATFWHIISEGPVEEERFPDLRRCERIAWPRPVIENADNHVVKIWEEDRKGETRIHLWFETETYLVVLAKRKDYLLLWTAYVVQGRNQKEKLKKRWEKSRLAALF